MRIMNKRNQYRNMEEWKDNFIKRQEREGGKRKLLKGVGGRNVGSLQIKDEFNVLNE